MRPAPAVTTDCDGLGAPVDVLGRPADGADDTGADTGADEGTTDEGAGLPEVGPALGTVRVVKRVLVNRVVVVESTASWLPVGLAELTDTTAEEDGPAPLPPSVMGQTVVLTATISVVTWPTGQLVTVGLHEVMV